MTRLPANPINPNRLPVLIPLALAGAGAIAWIDWSRRERRLRARTADRLARRG